MSRPTRLDLWLAAALLGALGLLASPMLRAPAPEGPHCGCLEPACALPCSSCCRGAQPMGCPPPAAVEEQ